MDFTTLSNGLKILDTTPVGVAGIVLSDNFTLINQFKGDTALSIATINTTLDGIGDAIDSIELSASNLSTTVAGHTTQIATISGNVSAVTSTASTNTTAINTLSTTVAGHTGTLATHTTQIAGKQSKITGHSVDDEIVIVTVTGDVVGSGLSADGIATASQITEAIEGLQPRITGTANNLLTFDPSGDVVISSGRTIASVPTFADITTAVAGVNLSSYLTIASAASTYATQAALSGQAASNASTYLTQTTAASTYQPISGMSSYLTVTAAANTYATNSSVAPTFLAFQSALGGKLDKTEAASTYATQTALTTGLNLKLNVSNPTFTGTLTGPSIAATTSVTSPKYYGGTTNFGVSLDLGGNAAFPAAYFNYPSGGHFVAGEISIYGTNDVFFQAYPASSSGWGYLEAWNGAGMVVGTGNNTPIDFRPNRTTRMRLSSAGRLLIGSTSDDGVHAIQVTGDASVSGTIITGTLTGTTSTITAGTFGSSYGGNTDTAAGQTALFVGSPMGNLTVNGMGELTAPKITTANGSGIAGITIANVTGLQAAIDGKLSSNGDGSHLTGISAGSSGGSKTVTIENPQASENVDWFFTTAAITATKITAVVRGGTTNVTYTVKCSTDRSATGTTVVSSTASSRSTGSVVTSFTTASIPANSFVWITTDGTTQDIAGLSMTMLYS